jgi:hypothetical protein
MGGRTFSKTTVVKFLLAGLAVLAVLAVPEWASAQGAGIRGGVSIDPDQFYFGGHYETDALVDRLHFRPNIEAGLGNDLTLVGLNFEFVYKFPRRNAWRIYAGGGPAINFYSFDRGPDRDRDSESEAGLNFLIGVQQTEGLFFEIKIGALDSPELKFGVGWSF